jgi:hypothetical protein
MHLRYPLPRRTLNYEVMTSVMSYLWGALELSGLAVKEKELKFVDILASLTSDANQLIVSVDVLKGFAFEPSADVGPSVLPVNVGEVVLELCQEVGGFLEHFIYAITNYDAILIVEDKRISLFLISLSSSAILSLVHIKLLSPAQGSS